MRKVVFFKYIFLLKCFSNQLGHKKAIGTLGYQIASKPEDSLAFGHFTVDRQTNASLYNIGIVN